MGFTPAGELAPRGFEKLELTPFDFHASLIFIYYDAILNLSCRHCKKQKQAEKRRCNNQKQFTGQGIFEIITGPHGSGRRFILQQEVVMAVRTGDDFMQFGFFKFNFSAAPGTGSDNHDNPFRASKKRGAYNLSSLNGLPQPTHSNKTVCTPRCNSFAACILFHLSCGNLSGKKHSIFM